MSTLVARLRADADAWSQSDPGWYSQDTIDLLREAAAALERDPRPRAEIHVIDHAKQRYPTAGDWIFGKGDAIFVAVSKLGDWRMELLIGLHELIEAALCKHCGVSEEAVTTFDLWFEEDRAAGKVGPEAEPGDDVRAPYYAQHAVATVVEKMLCRELGVDWQVYERAVLALDKNTRGD